MSAGSACGRGLYMKRCLIVDDSDAIRKVARHFIEQLGYEVFEAESGCEGLNHCKLRMPDVLVLDWLLQDMTGLEFLATLRLQAPPKRPFVLYFTTENDSAEISRAFSAGADDYLMKPFDRESLVRKFAATGLAA
jgi:two-component system chemotaxis response regulator CheY